MRQRTYLDRIANLTACISGGDGFVMPLDAADTVVFIVAPALAAP